MAPNGQPIYLPIDPSKTPSHGGNPEIERNSKRRHSILTRLIENGVNAPVYQRGTECEALEDIPWLDLPLLQDGYNFYEDNYVAYLFASAIFTLIGTFTIKPIAGIVFRDQGNKPQMDASEYFIKILKKFHGLETLFPALWDEMEIKRVINRIRKVHQLAARQKPKYQEGKPLLEILTLPKEPWMGDVVTAVKKDIGDPKPDNLSEYPRDNLLTWETPSIPISQFGMVSVAFAFSGSVWLLYHLFGLENRDDPKIRGVFHMWAVLCKLLGVQDKYNIYIDPKPEIIEDFANHVLVTSLENIDETVVQIHYFITTEVQKHVGLLTHKAMLLIALETVQTLKKPAEIKTDNLWALMNWREKFCYANMKFVVRVISKFPLVRGLAKRFIKSFLHRLFTELIPKKADMYKS